ncbi:MAG: tRNA A-37 threonylcarbamoyl transferase component Bud32 [Planctomycetota bacterium]|jgi:tRNA A-37 threonylcarbamoyl transferase component Bud32
MARRQQSTPLGTLHLQASHEQLLDAAAQLALELAQSDARPQEPIDFAGQPAFLKGAPLAPRSARRHALRRLLLRAPAPRMAEYRNLSWLSERLFEVPEPLAAGVLLRAGQPRYQFLITAQLEGARPLEECWKELASAECDAILHELAQEVARMHALHFVHRDLYPRNLMLRPAHCARRVVFLDAWAGGVGPGRRSATYDIGCLFLEGCVLFTPTQQELFLTRYFEERRVQEQAAERTSFLSSAQSARTALRKQLKQEPARRRGRPLPPQHWSPGDGRN